MVDHSALVYVPAVAAPLCTTLGEKKVRGRFPAVNYAKKRKTGFKCQFEQVQVMDY